MLGYSVNFRKDISALANRPLWLQGSFLSAAPYFKGEKASVGRYSGGTPVGEVEILQSTPTVGKSPSDYRYFLVISE